VTLLRYLLGFVVLLLFWGAGAAIAAMLPIAVPGSVIGMVLLTGALHAGLIRIEHVEHVSTVMLRYMALFFVPPGVAVILYLELLRDEWLALTVGTIAGTVAVILTVGAIQQRMEKGDG
jgi:holin-like protein